MMKLIKYREHDYPFFDYFFIDKNNVKVSPIFSSESEAKEWFTTVTGKPPEKIQNI